jgi:hypothetical protein
VSKQQTDKTKQKKVLNEETTKQGFNLVHKVLQHLEKCHNNVKCEVFRTVKMMSKNSNAIIRSIFYQDIHYNLFLHLGLTSHSFIIYVMKLTDNKVCNTVYTVVRCVVYKRLFGIKTVC